MAARLMRNGLGSEGNNRDPVWRAMTMEAQFRALDEGELLEFFGVEPVARTVEDGYWCYETSDQRGVTLRFSFNLYERSVQTALSIGGSAIATVSH